jgi:hypothetical protein
MQTDDMVYAGLDLTNESPQQIHRLAQVETTEKSVRILLFEAAIEKYGPVASPGLAYCLAEFGSFMNLESFITRALEMLGDSGKDCALIAYCQSCLLSELDRQRVRESSEFYHIDDDEISVPDIDEFISSRETETLQNLEKGIAASTLFLTRNSNTALN